MRPLIKCLCASLLILYASGLAQTQGSNEAAIKSDVASPSPGLEKRTFVLLKRTDRDRADTDEMKRLQTGHLANLRSMAEAGLLLVAGPLAPAEDGDPTLAGILVFTTPSKENSLRIESMLDEDPLIKAGYLIAQSHTLFFETGDNLYTRTARGNINGTD